MAIMKKSIKPIFMQKPTISNQRGGSFNMGIISATKEFLDGLKSNLRQIKAESIEQR